MRRRWVAVSLMIVLVGAVGLFAGASAAAVAEAEALAAAHAFQDASYVGHKDGCRKCHLKEHRSWSRTPHAKALDLLEGDDASNPECLECHTTGYGEASGFTSDDDTPELAGVTCESCHGAGSGYRDKDVMEDHDASVAAGLLMPDEATCLGCHNDRSPTFSGEFDFESRKEEGIHDIKR